MIHIFFVLTPILEVLEATDSCRRIEYYYSFVFMFDVMFSFYLYVLLQ